jgi:hypothetical protein
MAVGIEQKLVASHLNLGLISLSSLVPPNHLVDTKLILHKLIYIDNEN